MNHSSGVAVDPIVSAGGASDAVVRKGGGAEKGAGSPVAEGTQSGNETADTIRISCAPVFRYETPRGYSWVSCSFLAFRRYIPSVVPVGPSIDAFV